MRGVSFLCALFWCLSFAHAHSYANGAIQIGHPWVAPAATGADAVVHLVVYNSGAERAWLTGAFTTAASKVTLASPQPDGNTLTLNQFPLPAKKPVVFGDEVMRPQIHLHALTRALKAGESVPLTLQFGDGTSVRVSVLVETAVSQH